ncbi:S8 family serine peptidase [Arcanobacterium buesumense]|uniref:S8 family serine peptidase n=1 Tax=Arcanobacterium buesumense TaxID=2722751 RepID=A0A6H2ELD7_9ACTO|nr:S8 family serine peptidase [Arcanobacterium buesumense]QJC21911.1 S8 family serine peptidase [Arcanobacterium buesumense]
MGRFLKSAAFASVLAASLAFAPLAVALPASDARHSGDISLADMDRLLKEHGSQSSQRVRVLVMLKNQPTVFSEPSETANKGEQTALIDNWAKKYGLEAGRQLGFLVNGFAATMPANKIPALRQEPEVSSVKLERTFEKLEHNARKMEGVPLAYERHGLDGRGVVVSIIDSGIDPSHQDLQLTAEECAAAKLKPDTSHGSLFTCKVPAGYNFADDNYEIVDQNKTEHGQHVSGIVAAHGSAREGIDKPDVVANNGFDGVAPQAQLLAMKVFSNDPDARANDSDIIAAIETSVKLKADIINMSLGSANGNRNESDGVFRAIAKAREAGVLVVVAAGNEGMNFSLTGELDSTLTQLDDGTLGSPAADTGAFAVASIDNQVQVVPVATWRIGDNGEEQALPHKAATGKADGQPHKIVDLGYGQVTDFTPEKNAALAGNYALIQRGKERFSDMFERAFAADAKGVVVYNDARRGEEFIGMGGVEEYTEFSASTYHSVGAKLAEESAKGDVYVTFTQNRKLADFAGKKALRPSSFSSWGPTPTLDFAPHISGIGGEVYSTLNNNRYASDSGTSMAAPNVSGLSALMWQHYSKEFPELTGPERTDRIRAALMNTAQIPTNEDGVPYAPRQVGAGLARIDHAADTPVIATVDGLPYVSLREVNAPKTFTVTLHNYGTTEATYTVPAQQVVNEHKGLGQNTTTVVSDETLSASVETITVPAGQDREVSFTLNPRVGAAHFIEGWARLNGEDVPDIAIPYLGFVGDWNAEKIIAEPGQTWGDPVSLTATTGLATLREDITVPIGLLNDIAKEPGDDRDLTLWMSPNGDHMHDVIFPQLLVRRNASDVVYEVESEDGTFHQTTGKQQDLRRYTLKTAMEPTMSNDTIVQDSSEFGFDGKIYDPKNVDYQNVPDGRYIFRVKTRVSDDYDWQVTEMPFGIDTSVPTITFGDYDEANGYAYFTVNDSGSGIQTKPLVDTDQETNLVAERVNNSDSEFRVKVKPGTTHIIVSAGDMASNIAIDSHILDPARKLSVTFAQDMQNGPVGPIKPYFTTQGDPEGAKLNIEGYTAEEVERVTVNGGEADLADRYFFTQVPIEPGQNEIEVVAYNARGDVVSTVELTPFYDDEKPTVTIDTPAPVADNMVTITGTITDTNKDAQLSVSAYDEAATIDRDGRFTLQVEVGDETETVTVIASDGAQRVITVVPIAGRGADVVVPPAPPLPGGPILPPPPPPLPGDDYPLEAELPTIDNAQCSPEIAVCAVPTDTTDYNRETKVFTMRGMLDPDTVAKFQLVPTGEAGDGKVIEPTPLVAKIDETTGMYTLDVPATTGQNDFRLELYVPDENGNEPVRVQAQTFKLLIDVNVPEIHIDQPLTVGGSIFTSSNDIVFTGKVSDDGWGYKFQINKDTVEERENNSGHGPQSNEREFTYPIKVDDGDNILLTVVDRFGNQVLGIFPVVVDKDKPTVGASYMDKNLEEDMLLTDDSPVVAAAKDANLRSFKVTLTDSLGQQVLDETKYSEIDVTERKLEELMIDVRDIQEESAQELEKSGIGKLSAAPVNKANNKAGEPEGQAEEHKPTVENETFVTGSEATVVTDELMIPVDTQKLGAGIYTLAMQADDLAGNMTMRTVAFAVDRLPQISGPDVIDVTMTKEQMSDLAQAGSLIFPKYSIDDDGSADFAGDGSGRGEAYLVLDPSTILVSGKNTVMLRAVQPNGMESHKLITVNVTVHTDASTQTPDDSQQPGESNTSPDNPGKKPGVGSGDVFGLRAPTDPQIVGSSQLSGSLATTGTYAALLALLAGGLITSGMVLNRRAV